MIALLLSMFSLSGCSEEEIREQTRIVLWEMAKEASREFADYLSAQLTEYFRRTFQPYEKEIDHDWTPILTSYYENEKLEILQRHGNGMMGVHCTYYMVTLSEDGVCTYYLPAQYVPCKDLKWFFWCNNKLASFEEVSGSGNMHTVYLYAMDVVTAQTLLELQQNGYSIEQFSALITSTFGKVSIALAESLLSDGLSNAIDTIVGGNQILSELRDLQSHISDAADISATTKEDDLKTQEDESFVDKAERIESSDAVTEEMSKGFALATTPITMANDLADAGLSNTVIGAEEWKNLKKLSKLSPDGEELDFRVTDTHIQWKLRSETEWKDLEALEELSPDGEKVLFQVTDTHIQWRFLSVLEKEVMIAQKSLHEAAKRVCYPVE